MWKNEKKLSPKKSSNQRFSNFFSKPVNFTKFLQKKISSKHFALHAFFSVKSTYLLISKLYLLLFSRNIFK